MTIKLPLVELGDVCKIKGGKRLPKDDELVEIVTSHPYIRARDISNGKINFSSPIYITDATYEKIKRYTVREGDVIITIVGANIGDVAMVDAKFSGANLTENAVKLTAQKGLLAKYLKYALVPSYMKGYFQTVASGAAQGKLGLYKIKKIQIPLPPLPTQQKIARILSAYDELIENNLQRIKLLEEMAQITYEQWFVRMKFPGHETTAIDAETGLPEGWISTSLADATILINRGISPQYVEEDGFPVINQKCIRDRNVNFSESRLTSNSKKIDPNKLLKRFDILVNSTGTGTLGRVAQLMNQPGKSTADTHVTIVRVKPGISALYVGRVLELLQPFIENLGKGATNQQELGRSDLGDIVKVVIPEYDLQQKYDAIASPLFQSSLNLRQQNQFLKEARDILLPRLMTGMIDVDTIQLPEANKDMEAA